MEEFRTADTQESTDSVECSMRPGRARSIHEAPGQQCPSAVHEVAQRENRDLGKCYCAWSSRPWEYRLVHLTVQKPIQQSMEISRNALIGHSASAGMMSPAPKGQQRFQCRTFHPIW